VKIQKRLISIRELSEYLSVSASTLYMWAGEGVIPSVKIGGKILFDIADIDRMIENLKRKRCRNGRVFH